MPDITLTPAGPDDIATLEALAHRIWNQHYPAVIGQEQVNYMLNLMYSQASLREQMLQKEHRFFLIKTGLQLFGFISVNKESGSGWFLNKFYIDQSLAGKGNGASAFEELKKIIQPDKITLTCNRQNYKSINFYFKLGFKIERVADFDIGNGYVMNDFVMVWTRIF